MTNAMRLEALVSKQLLGQFMQISTTDFEISWLSTASTRLLHVDTSRSTAFLPSEIIGVVVKKHLHLVDRSLQSHIFQPLLARDDNDRFRE